MVNENAGDPEGRTMPRTKQRPLNPPASEKAAPNGIGETPEVLTLEEAASYFRVPADVVLRMIDAEGLPARRFGADWRFYKAALQAWLGAARPKRGILNHIGRIEDDPYAQEMLAEIYARRRRLGSKHQ
jgi:excisionase family DNA binding protein